MSCAQFELWIVSDDPQEQCAAEEHARTCRRCGTILAGQQQLSSEIRDWRDTVEAPPGLETKVVEVLGHQGSQAKVRPFRSFVSRTSGPLVWAVAASLVLGFGLAWLLFQVTPRAPQTASRLLIEEALELAESAEREHPKAIARLEVAAAPILAGAHDLDMQAHQAARLMEYSDRLAYLDSTIDEIQGYVASNPGQARARTLLLAAYKQKTQVLREVVALEERS